MRVEWWSRSPLVQELESNRPRLRHPFEEEIDSWWLCCWSIVRSTSSLVWFWPFNWCTSKLQYMRWRVRKKSSPNIWLKAWPCFLPMFLSASLHLSICWFPKRFVKKWRISSAGNRTPMVDNSIRSPQPNGQYSIATIHNCWILSCQHFVSNT